MLLVSCCFQALICIRLCFFAILHYFPSITFGHGKAKKFGFAAVFRFPAVMSLEMLLSFLSPTPCAQGGRQGRSRWLPVVLLAWPALAPGLTMGSTWLLSSRCLSCSSQ